MLYMGFFISHEIRICGINQSGFHGMSEPIGSVYGIFTCIVLI